MDTANLAQTYLTVGERSMWADLAGRVTRLEERRTRLVDPWAVTDVHCERLTMGALLLYSGARTGAVRAGLAPWHFSNRSLSQLYQHLMSSSPDSSLARAGLAPGPESMKALLRLMNQFADVETAVDQARWRQWSPEDGMAPSWVEPAEVVRALAARLVRLAQVRRKLREANELMAGEAALGLGGVGL